MRNSSCKATDGSYVAICSKNTGAPGLRLAGKGENTVSLLRSGRKIHFVAADKL